MAKNVTVDLITVNTQIVLSVRHVYFVLPGQPNVTCYVFYFLFIFYPFNFTVHIWQFRTNTHSARSVYTDRVYVTAWIF